MLEIRLESEYYDLNKYKDHAGNIFYLKKDTSINHNPYGPAYISKNGIKIYIINEKYHRLDGPAVIFPNGEEQYYINGECLAKEQFESHPERLKYLGKEYLICLK